MNIEKLLKFHKKEAWMGSIRGQAERAEFHNKAVILLEQINQQLVKGACNE